MIEDAPRIKDIPKLIIPLIKFIIILIITIPIYIIIYPSAFVFALFGTIEFIIHPRNVIDKIWNGKKQIYIIKFSHPNSHLIIPTKNRALADKIQVGNKITFRPSLRLSWPIPETSDFLKIIS